MKAYVKHCKICGKSFQATLSVDRFCSFSCALLYNNRRKDEKSSKNNVRKTRINPVSKKQAGYLREYAKLRKEILGRGYRCAVYPEKMATEIHHVMKRRGYADAWAREKNIPLIIDPRYFLPVSREGHEFIENNPKEAYLKGWSKKANKK